jgi:predicted amidophosphoribosyltransferase
MDPITIYLLLFLGAVAICLVCGLMAQPNTRACPGCGEALDIQARKCRSCGYRPR